MECHIEHEIMLDLATVTGDNFFGDIGEWVMKCVAYYHLECASQNVKPCIHVETLMMTRTEFQSFIVGAFLDELGIDHRGTSGTLDRA